MLPSRGSEGGMSTPLNVLYLYTGDSARPILAEALLNREGADRFRAFSAGSVPKGEVHPMALEVPRELGFSTDSLRSKSWDEFAAPGARGLDFIFTVRDNAAGEVCPGSTGRRTTARWDVPDPAGEDRPGQWAAFLAAFKALRRLISDLLALPLDRLERVELRRRLIEIGERHEMGARLG